MTVTKSLNSTATLLCEPPPMSTTPGASCVFTTWTCGAGALRTLSGTVSAASATFIL